MTLAMSLQLIGPSSCDAFAVQRASAIRSREDFQEVDGCSCQARPQVQWIGRIGCCVNKTRQIEIRRFQHIIVHATCSKAGRKELARHGLTHSTSFNYVSNDSTILCESMCWRPFSALFLCTTWLPSQR